METWREKVHEKQLAVEKHIIAKIEDEAADAIARLIDREPDYEYGDIYGCGARVWLSGDYAIVYEWDSVTPGDVVYVLPTERLEKLIDYLETNYGS